MIGNRLYYDESGVGPWNTNQYVIRQTRAGGVVTPGGLGDLIYRAELRKPARVQGPLYLLGLPYGQLVLRKVDRRHSKSFQQTRESRDSAYADGPALRTSNWNPNSSKGVATNRAADSIDMPDAGPGPADDRGFDCRGGRRVRVRGGGGCCRHSGAARVSRCATTIEERRCPDKSHPSLRSTGATMITGPFLIGFVFDVIGFVATIASARMIPAVLSQTIISARPWPRRCWRWW